MSEASYSASWEFDTFADGTLYRTQGEKADAAVALLERIVGNRREIATLECLDAPVRGGAAEVRAMGDIAVKLFHDTRFARLPNVSGVPYLMASIALQAGIDRLGDCATFQHQGNSYTVKAPKMYAHFIPHNKPPISLMERMPGAPMAPSRALEAGLRIVYNSALWTVGLRPNCVILDTASRNVLQFQSDKRRFMLSRLDVVAR